jgi:CheY-like chemotaxis protein
VKVLLVEDDENKRKNLRECLLEIIPGVSLDQAASLQTGLRALRQNAPDLIVLDMTLPNYEPGPDEPGGQPHLFGGREFLRQMDRYDILIPVIVVTQFSAFGTGKHAKDLAGLDDELRSEHGAVYRGAIHYNSAVLGWKDELRSRIEGLN